MPESALSIEVVGPDRRARRLRFSDGTTRVTARSVVTALALADGDVVDPTDVLHRIGAAEYPQAMERALRLVGYRERSRAETLRRLADDGYPSHIALQVTDRLVELELIDDERFARAYLRTRLLAGYGFARIRRELLSKGIEPDLLATLLTEEDEEAQSTAIEREISRVRTWNKSAEQRVTARLMRRGHSQSSIRAAIARSRTEQPFITE
jgi:regulatory protein